MLKKLLFYGICYLLTGIIVLFSAEFGLRILAPNRTLASFLQFDSKLGYRHIPHSNTTQYLDGRYIPMRTNGMGLRQDEEIKEKKPPNEFRVLIMGDSYVLGWGTPIEKTFYTLIKNKAVARFSERDIFFMNGGHGAWGTEQLISFIEDEFPKLKPDLVVFFLGGNDILTNKRLNDLYFEKGNSFVRNSDPKTLFANRSWFARQIPFYDWLLYHSYLFQRARPLFRSLPVNFANWGGLVDNGKNYSPTELPPRLSPAQRVLTAKKVNLIEGSEVEKKTVKLLSYAKNLCDKNGAAFLILNTGGASSETSLFFDKLPVLLKGTNLEYHDFRPHWEHATLNLKTPLYLSDGHLSEAGNSVFADTIWPLFEKKLSSLDKYRFD